MIEKFVPHWRVSEPTGTDQSFWIAEESKRRARINELVALFPDHCWSRTAKLPAPRALTTNGEWSDWLLALEEGCCDVIRACRVDDELNPHLPEKRVRRYPPSVMASV